MAPGSASSPAPGIHGAGPPSWPDPANPRLPGDPGELRGTPPRSGHPSPPFQTRRTQARSPSTSDSNSSRERPATWLMFLPPAHGPAEETKPLEFLIRLEPLAPLGAIAGTRHPESALPATGGPRRTLRLDGYHPDRMTPLFEGFGPGESDSMFGKMPDPWSRASRLSYSFPLTRPSTYLHQYLLSLNTPLPPKWTGSCRHRGAPPPRRGPC